MILLVGGIMSVRCRFVQRHLVLSFKSIFVKEKGEGDISPFGALCTTLAATLGTGNIVGVATAVAIGGPGALFWMVISALAGMAIKFAECMLAVCHRRRTSTGYYGGPFLYIEQKMGKVPAMIFALCGAAAGSISIGTTLQMDSVIGVLDPMRESGTFSMRSFVICLITAVLAGIVLWGGAVGISRFCEAVIPIMSVGYIVCCLVILVRFRSELPNALVLIVKSAFCPAAAVGGAAGSFVRTVQVGMSRGIYSNEAGLGSAPIAAAAARGESALRQGLIAMSGVFLDTVVMCFMTGLCVVVTGSWQSHSGAAITAAAFEMALGEKSVILLSLFLCFFAFTTIVGWYFFAGACFEYLTDGRGEKLFRLFYVGMLMLTPFIQSDRLWALADVLNAGMALPNLTALLLYQKEIATYVSDWEISRQKTDRYCNNR